MDFDGLREMGVGVASRSADDNLVCPACREIENVVYFVDDAPPLPHANCTNPDGCRCAYNPIPVDAYSEEELAAMKWATPDTLKKIQQARTITAPPPPKPGKQPGPTPPKPRSRRPD